MSIPQILPEGRPEGAASAALFPSTPAIHPIKSLARPTTAEQMVAVGEALLALKDEHRGTFKAYVEANCDFDYRSAARYMSAAREAAISEHVETVRRFTSNDQFAPTGLSCVTLGPTEMFGSWCLNPEQAVGYLVRHNPRLPSSSLADWLRAEISFLESAVAGLTGALSIVTRLPSESLPALSEAGRTLNIADKAIKSLQAGDTERGRLRMAAEAAHDNAVARAWSIAIGNPLSIADAAALHRSGGVLHGISEPMWPKNDSELAAYISMIEAEIAPSALAQSLDLLRSSWDTERSDMGLACSFDLPPAERAELERRLTAWIEGNYSWDNVQAIYWPDIPAPPDVKTTVETTLRSSFAFNSKTGRQSCKN